MIIACLHQQVITRHQALMNTLLTTLLHFSGSAFVSNSVFFLFIQVHGKTFSIFTCFREDARFVDNGDGRKVVADVN